MKKIRITVAHNPKDPSDDLRYASQVRHNLWAHSPAEISPESPSYVTRRDAARNAFFEFSTDYLPEVEKVLETYHDRKRVSVEVLKDQVGPPCLNCGCTLETAQLTVCPNCRFRDITPCPFCKQEIGRRSYEPVCGNLFKCPACGHRVYLDFHDPQCDSDGHLLAPAVIVEAAE